MRTLETITPELLRPRVHPNGFIQINLSADGWTRLHIWPDGPLAKQNSDNTIHDHVFDFDSRVVLGALRNHLVVVQEDKKGDHEIYQARYQKKSQSTLQATGRRCFAREVSAIRYDAGYKYSMIAFAFHDSVADGLTATIMQKSAVYTGNPRVLCPVGVPPDNSFVRESTSYEGLWPYVIRVLEQSQEASWYAHRYLGDQK